MTNMQDASPIPVPDAKVHNSCATDFIKPKIYSPVFI